MQQDAVYFSESEYEEMKTLHVAQPSLVTLVLRSREVRPVTESISLIPGIYEVTVMFDPYPEERIWFRVEMMDSHAAREVKNLA